MVDIDKFKNINDTFGHKAGDNALMLISQVIKNSMRSTDTVARWGGEEFIMLIVNTDKEEVLGIAEKLRKSIAEMTPEDTDSITASFGITFFNEGDNEEAFVSRADKALYKAKENGRNRIDVVTI